MKTPRTCTNCHQTKSIPRDFYTSGKTVDGRQRWKTWCKQCELEEQKIKRMTVPEYKEYHAEQSAEWQRNNHARYLELLRSWRERRRARGLKATVRDLTLVDLIARRNQRRETGQYEPV